MVGYNLVMKINYTIIIPHYNIPDLLMRCLRSIPIREDIQVIVIDDCSPNADTYLSNYPELSRPYLEFYSTEIGGSAGRARNVGLDHAKGKWLIFADADDFFENGFVIILDSLVDSKDDVIYFDYRSVKSDDLSKPSTRDDTHHYYLQTYHNKNIYARSYFPCPVAKMVRKSLVESYKIRFDETRWSNDFYFSVSIGCYAESINFDNHVIYVICERKSSLTFNFCEKKEENIIRAEVALRCLNLSCSHNYILMDIEHPLIFIMRKLWKRNKLNFLNLYFQLSKKAEEIFYNQFCKKAKIKRRILMKLFHYLYCIKDTCS